RPGKMATKSAGHDCKQGRKTALAPALAQRKMVGAVRFELTTSCTRNKRATRLRYAPTQGRKKVPGLAPNCNVEIQKSQSFRFARLPRNASVRCAWNHSGNDSERRRHRARRARGLGDSQTTLRLHAIVLQSRSR